MSLSETAQELQKIERLLQSANEELELYRALLYRVHQTSPDLVLKPGEIRCPITFEVSFKVVEEGVQLSVFDAQSIGLTSKYQRIYQQIRELV